MSLNFLVDFLIWYAFVCLSIHWQHFILLFLSFIQPYGSINKEHGELLRWVTDTRQRLTHFIEAPIRDILAEYKVIVEI